MVGDHIRVSKGGRWLHAIDCGDETVLHAANGAATPGANRIVRTYRPEFVAGARAVEVVNHRARVYAPGAVVARAFSRAADPALAAMFADSEAFAVWCKTGRLPGWRNVALASAAKPGTKSRSKSQPKPKPKPASRSKPKSRPASRSRPSSRSRSAAPAKRTAPARAARPKAKVKAKRSRPASRRR